MKVLPLPSQRYLLSCFDYDPNTGELRWKARPGTRSRATGKLAGTWAGPHRDKLQVVLDGQRLLASRIIWKLMTGKDPAAEIDHRDTDSRNNKWANLREADRSRNCCNRSRTNKHGYKGVTYHKGGYVARVTYQGKVYYAGRATTAQGAYQKYLALASRLHGAFHHP